MALNVHHPDLEGDSELLESNWCISTTWKASNMGQEQHLMGKEGMSAGADFSELPNSTCCSSISWEHRQPFYQCGSTSGGTQRATFQSLLTTPTTESSTKRARADSSSNLSRYEQQTLYTKIERSYRRPAMRHSLPSQNRELSIETNLPLSSVSASIVNLPEELPAVPDSTEIREFSVYTASTRLHLRRRELLYSRTPHHSFYRAHHRCTISPNQTSQILLRHIT